MVDDPIFWMIAVALALPVWATLRILRSDLPKQKKFTCLIGTWIMPVIGPIAMLIEVPRRGRSATGSTGAITIDTPAPEAIELPGREPFPVRAHLLNGNGFPILDWKSLDEWATPDAAQPVSHGAIQNG